MTGLPDQHIYYHTDPASPRVNVKAERNSKGWNYEATITGAESPEEALRLLRATIAELEKEYGASAKVTV